MLMALYQIDINMLYKNIFLAFIIIFSGCLGSQLEFGHGKLFFERQNITLLVELATTQEQIRQGLMYREHLGENEGMLFDMGFSSRHSFWMYNTLIPLDAIFLDEQMRIVDMQTMVPCGSSNPSLCPSYTSKALARYVLEVNSGFAKRHGLKVGDKARLISADG
jgi:uncharacterized membrane protein (UPF0127 family)